MTEYGQYLNCSNYIMRALVLVGALCTRLAGDASRVQAATGARIGIIVQTLSGIGSQVHIQKRYTNKMFFLHRGVLKIYVT
jgi:hypothetical protein